MEVRSNAEVDERGRLRIQHTDLLPLEAFEARFEALMSAGLPWINVSCCGLDRGRLVFLVETPQEARPLSSRTSVNYSGPTNAARERGWDVGEVLAIT